MNECIDMKYIKEKDEWRAKREMPKKIKQYEFSLLFIDEIYERIEDDNLDNTLFLDELSRQEIY